MGLSCWQPSTCQAFTICLKRWLCPDWWLPVLAPLLANNPLWLPVPGQDHSLDELWTVLVRSIPIVCNIVFLNTLVCRVGSGPVVAAHLCCLSWRLGSFRFQIVVPLKMQGEPCFCYRVYIERWSQKRVHGNWGRAWPKGWVLIMPGFCLVSNGDVVPHISIFSFSYLILCWLVISLVTSQLLGTFSFVVSQYQLLLCTDSSGICSSIDLCICYEVCIYP